MSGSGIGALAAAASVLIVLTLPIAAHRPPRLPAHPDAVSLAEAGWRSGLVRWEVARGITLLAGVGLAAALGAVPLAGGILAIGPSIAVRLRAQAARDRARAELPRLLAAVHGGLRSGIALPQAIRRACGGCDDALARGPFARALTRFDLGDPLDAALRAAAADVREPRLVEALHTLALGVAERLPIERTASLVGSIAERASHEARLDGEVRARSAGVRLQSYVLAAVVPGMAIYLAATMPGLARTLSEGIGRTVLLPLAALLEVAGIALGRRIIRTVAR